MAKHRTSHNHSFFLQEIDRMMPHREMGQSMDGTEERLGILGLVLSMLGRYGTSEDTVNTQQARPSRGGRA